MSVAKALGAEVTAVCSTQNVDTGRSLGADHVVDYSKDDFTRTGDRYDLLLDVAGSRSWSGASGCSPRGDPRHRRRAEGNRLLGPLGGV